MGETLLDKIRSITLRIDEDIFDDDIQETINACKADMELNGIRKEKILESDDLIIRAIKLFCKVDYSADEKEADRCRVAYESLRNHLALSTDYTREEE